MQNQIIKIKYMKETLYVYMMKESRESIEA